MKPEPPDFLQCPAIKYSQVFLLKAGILALGRESPGALFVFYWDNV